MLKEKLALLTYAVSVSLVVLATGLTWLAWPHNQAAPYAFYYLAAVLAAFYGGWRAGALATLIGALLGDYLFIPPFFSWRMLHSIEGAVHVSVFTTVSALMVGLVESLRRTQGRMEDKEQQLRLFIEHAPAAVAMFDRDIRYLAASQRWMTVYQLNGPVLGLSHYEAFPDLRETCKDVFRRALEGETLRAEEDRVERADGTIQWLRWEVRPWRHANDTIGGIAIFTEDITERKQAEQTVEQSMRQYKDLVHSINGVIWEADAVTTQFTFVSPQVEAMLGYTVEEWLSSPTFWVDHMHPEDRSWAPQYCHEEARNHRGHTFEYRMLAADGRIVWFRDLVSVLVEDGEVTKLHGILDDITDRKQAEQALRTSEENLKQALLASNTGLWYWNTQTGEVFFSKEWKNQLGFSEADLPNRFDTWETGLHPDDRLRVTAYVQNYLAHPEGEYRQEFRLRHKDGTYRWIEARASFVTEADGRRIRLLGAHTDVTERKEMEEAVRESEERYRTLVELLPSGVFVLSEGRTVYINPAGTVLLGAKAAQEILDRPTFELIHPDYHPVVRKSLKRMLSGGVSVHHAERVYLKVDGTPIPVQLEAAPITWNGKLAILGLFSDITERKQAEEKLRLEEERLRFVTLATRDAIYDWDVHAKTVQRNDSYQALFSPGEPTGTGSEWWEARLHPDDGQRIMEGLSRVFNEKIPFWSDEYRLMKSDGTYASVVDRGYILYGEDGQPSRMIGAITDITERKQAEEQLRESELRFRALVERMGDVFWITDPINHKIVYVSQTFADIWGRNPDDLYDRFETWLDGIHEDDRARVAKDFYENILAGTYDTEYRIVRPDGSMRWIRDRGKPLGIGVLGAGVAEDITERKQAEAALDASQQRLQFLLTSNPTVIYSSKATHDYPATFVSDNVQTVVGYEAQQFLDNPGFWLDHIHPDDKADVLAKIERGLSEGKQIRYEYRFRCADRRYRWILDEVTPITNESGQVQELVGYWLDVTSRRQTELLLRESEPQLRVVFGQAAAGIAQFDPTGRFTLMNERYCEITGYAREELLGMRFQDITHPDDLPQNMALFQSLINGEPSFVMEKRYLRKDGSSVWVSNHVGAVRDAAGELQSLAAVVVDITERKQAEEALRETDRLKDEFLATLAHELRNPLTPISNGLHILQMPGGNSETVADVYKMMNRQVSHLIRLVDDLMEVSRITRRKVGLSKERIDLTNVLQNAIETSRYLIDEARHQLDVSLPTEPLYLKADPVRLTEVFANLLNNSAKYTKDEGRIWLSARRERSNAVVSVRDNGMGIPAEMLPKVFDLFTQADRTYHRAHGGLGIGLTLAHRLVAMHGGSVEAKSEGPGKGSEFVVRLPLAATSHNLDASTQDQDDALTVSPHRILVVDDNRDIRDSLALLLKRLGAECATANDGQSALDTLKTFRPSVVLLDIGMPDMDGFEVARRIRQLPEGRDVTLIVLTGWGQEVDRRHSREAGINHHLVKPVNFTILKELLANLPADDKADQTQH